MRIGYACLSVLVKDCSPARTVTATRLQQVAGEDDRRAVCRRIAQENLRNTRRLVFHNAAHGLCLYRITPQLVPLATHPLTAGWDWAADLAADFAAVGEAMRDHHLRISSHPGQYAVLNSPNDAVVAAAVQELEYHARLHERLDHGGVGRIILHAGGGQGGKEAALDRLERNLERVSPAVRRRLALENDDTVFGTGDLLPFCRRVGLPLVLDLHHHLLLPAGADLKEVLPAIFATWPAGERPKIHVSSPRSAGKPKAHADYVDAPAFRAFLALAAAVGAGPFDVMVEAKMKDAAALQLAAQLGLELGRDACRPDSGASDPHGPDGVSG